jgi:hypothetical protein
MGAGCSSASRTVRLHPGEYVIRADEKRDGRNSPTRVSQVTPRAQQAVLRLVQLGTARG